MPTVEISQESLDFVQQLVRTIKAQDNRATAAPYFYVIQERATVIMRDGHGDEKRWFDWDAVESYTREELIAEDREEHDDGLDDEERFARAEESRNLEQYDVKKEWVDCPGASNVFLTEEAYHAHMEINGHNFRNEARSYVKHAFRNKEMGALFKLLEELGGE